MIKILFIVLAALAIGCDDEPKYHPVMLTKEDRKLLPSPESGIEIYDTLAYINRQKLHSKIYLETAAVYHNGSDMIYFPKVDSIKVGKGAWLVHYRLPDSLPKSAWNGAFRSNPCKYELPPKHEMLRNTVTGKYCIGRYFKNVDTWTYWGANGYTDTCKLKEDFMAAFEMNEEVRNQYYQPIKK